MEFEAVTTQQLADLALSEDTLRPHFAGVFAANELPTTPNHLRAQGYIVNTDPGNKPGRHWIAIWTENDFCQIMDSFGLPLAAHNTPHLQSWIRTHWKVVEANTHSLQAVNSATCGHYALRFLVDRSQGKTFRDFLERFDPYDYVYNDALIASWMKYKMLRYQPPQWIHKGSDGELVYRK